jgi:hypothetical protein
MVTFQLLFASSVTGAFNVPLKAAMVIIFQLTGGYLLSPIMVEAVLLLCVIFVPAGALTTPLFEYQLENLSKPWLPRAPGRS